ncbi:SusC/RagA family TonB-linked outer membrane protein [Sinomicrobium soli]|uniref:SusC/RagA family TonB-linked outer membrane protein n=1 Tax=Sinomicrobium sp. N-1-3-6 TaxID=2219864 RepID=UPI000DCC46C3|nr:TonB-dependent receptor [Sinomicrobium sp. N-1-3-6]RAV29574.1 TonB-dependent receptor [Sinomicrobium sp. N-1-3-6]
MRKIILTTITLFTENRKKIPREVCSILAILMFFTGYSSVIYSQSLVTISGTVVDEGGVPMPGVNVIQLNSTRGATTDFDGNFKIEVDEGSIVEFSYIGYETFVIEKAAATMSEMNIIMKPNASKLDEVVVIGYGEQKRSDVTGSVSSIKADDIVESGNTDVLGAIQGKIAGVRINAQSGEPGAAMDIQIRGASSLYGSSSPLFVIDGVPYDMNADEVANAEETNIGHAVNPLSDLDPNSIESMEVLKDASATAIYGSRGANGVVIITTKSGTPGKSRINYHGYTSFSEAATTLDLLNGDDWIDYQRIVRPESPLFYEIVDGNIDTNSPIDPYAYKQTDWQKEAFRNAITQSHSISISGGNKQTTWAGGVSYLDKEGVIRRNDYERLNARLKVDHKHTDKLRVGINLNGSTETNEGATNTGLANSANGIVQRIIMSRPVQYYDPSTDDELTGFITPLSMIDNAEKSTNTIRMTGNVYAEYSFLPELKLKVDAGGRLSSSKGKMFYGSNTIWGNLNNGIASLQERRSGSWNFITQLSYNKRFNRIHKIDATGVFEAGHYNYEYQSMRSTDFMDESTGIDDISKGALVSSVRSSRWSSNRVSWLGRVNYSLLWRYLFTVSFRVDGSDKFGPGNRYGYFPSFAFAWQAHKEDFLKSVDALTELKLRLSYGETGNERIPAYRYFSEMENTFYASGGSSLFGMSPGSLANPDLKWETTRQFNTGVDIGLFKNRLNITADYYIKQTHDMLLPASIASETGYTQQWRNMGRLDNTGVELSINSVNVNTKDWNWTTNFNISANRNTIKDLGDIDYIPVIMTNGTIANLGRVQVGHSLGTGYGFVWDGIYQIDDFIWQEDSNPEIPHESRNYELKDGVPSVAGATVQPGGHKFKDLNGDGVVDDDNDRTFISRSLPKHVGGFSSNLSYKNFDFNFFFEWSYGGDMINLGKRLVEGPGGGVWNLSQDFYDNRWTPENQGNTHPDFLINNPTSSMMSSYYVEDASYLRLSSVTLSYTLPDRWLDKTGFSNVKVYVKGTNLHVWTNYSSFDPDVRWNNNLLPGVDRFAYPRPRSYIVGLMFSL